MKKRNLIVLALISCLNLGFSQDTVVVEEWDSKVNQEEKSRMHLHKLKIIIEDKTDEVLTQGEKTLNVLNSTLEFMEKILNDKEFRKCVVLNAYKDEFLQNKSDALELLNSQEVTKTQYDKYVKRQNKSLAELNSRIKNQECK